MKKIALLLVFALILGCACAEPTLVNTLENADWIDGTNLLRVPAETGYAIADISGNPITEPIYANSFTYSNGVITAYLPNGDEFNVMGAFKTDGSVAIPFQYGDVRVLSSEWAVGYVLASATKDNYDYSSWTSEDVYLIDHVDIYSLITGATLSLPRADFASASVVGHSINIENRSTGEVSTYDENLNLLGGGLKYTSDDEYAVQDIVTFYQDGDYGLKDGSGNVILEPSYDYISTFRGDYAEVELGGRYGLIDKAGNLLVPVEYDGFETSYYLSSDVGGGSGYCASGYFCVEKDGKLGYVTAAGITSAPKYAKDNLENNGASATFTDMEGNFNILAADGVVTPVSGYDRVRCAYYSNGFYYVVTDADYNYGLIDWHGNVIFPCQYSDIALSGDGQYVLVEVDYERAEIYSLAMPEPAVEAPAAEIPAAEAPAADNPAKTLLESAKLVMAADASAAIALIDSAAAMLVDSPAAAMLEGAKALLAADASANAAAIAALIDNAIAML